MRSSSFLIFLTILISSCGSDQAPIVDEITPQKTNSFSDIIRNPVSHDGTIDSINVAKMTFDEPIFDFGNVEEGTMVKHDFTFTNTGKVGLLITEAQSTCGCTVPDYPKDIIEPGHRGVIHVAFASQGRTKKQDKPITITANTYPSRSVIRLKGYVEPLNEEN